MESQPLVSVIMPCYNMASYISDSIKSVIVQTYPNWELLIVDDASTDETVSIIKDYSQSDSRIRFAIKTQNSGIADTRNQCIQMAQGQFLAFLDADDIWHPEKLEKQLRFMMEKNVGFTYSTYDWIDEDGNTLNKFINTIGNLSYETYLQNTIIGCSTVMVNKAITGDVVVPKFRTSEDTATWLDILRKGLLAYAIDEPLVSYRIRRKSASSNKIKAATDLWKVYRRHEKLPLFKAIYYFSCYYKSRHRRKRQRDDRQHEHQPVSFFHLKCRGKSYFAADCLEEEDISQRRHSGDKDNIQLADLVKELILSSGHHHAERQTQHISERRGNDADDKGKTDL